MGANNLHAKKFHLPQLDGLRFFAFFAVFIHHYNPPPEIFKTDHPLLWSINNKFFTHGGLGVDIFFCLSSFLLTSLIILEYRKTGHFSIKNFLMRRMLRIWPLYYLTLVLAFLVLPSFSAIGPTFHTKEYSTYLSQHLLPFSLFMGNFSYAFFADSLTAVISALWTISLEEQFYILCPIVLYILLPKNKLWFVSFFMLLALLSIIVRFYILSNLTPAFPAVWVFSLARLEPFAFGALLSYFYLSDRFQPSSWYALISLIASVVIFQALTNSSYTEYNTFWYLFVMDIACLCLMYAVIQSKVLSKLFSLKLLTWLGKISFGLYVFHKIVIYFVAVSILPYFYNSVDIYNHPVLFHWFSFAVTFLFTILAAAFSYYFFERNFLKLKKNYTAIASRPI